jgi:hypothetical protein
MRRWCVKTTDVLYSSARFGTGASSPFLLICLANLSSDKAVMLFEYSLCRYLRCGILLGKLARSFRLIAKPVAGLPCLDERIGRPDHGPYLIDNVIRGVQTRNRTGKPIELRT